MRVFCKIREAVYKGINFNLPVNPFLSYLHTQVKVRVGLNQRKLTTSTGYLKY